MKNILTISLIAACILASPLSIAGVGFDFVHVEEHLFGTGDKPCDETYFTTSDTDGKIIKKREYEFEKAACLVNKSRTSPGGFNAQSDYEDAVELFYKSSQKGLDAAKQNYANLLEGLAHCQLAKIKSNGMEEAFAKKIEFCTEWRMGRNALSQVSWRTLLLKTLDNTQGDATPASGQWQDVDIAPLIEEYQLCYGDSGGLSDDYSSACGKIKAPSWEAIKKIAGESIEKQIEENFAGDSAPFTAIFQRKLAVIQNNLDKIEASRDALESLKNAVQKEFEELRGVYDSKKEERSKIIDNYKSFVLEAKQILESVERIKKGLLVDKNGVDHKDRLQETKKTLTQSIDYHEDQKDFDKLSCIAKNLGFSIQTKTNLSEIKQQFCRIYYCHLLSQRNIRVTRFVGNDFQYFDNPLKINIDNEISDGHIKIPGASSIHVSDFCKNAGLNEEYLVPELSIPLSEQCLGEF